MNVIALRTLRDFYEKHPIAKNPLAALYKNLKSQDWQKPPDAVDCFGVSNVDILKNDRICINVKGNNLRVVIAVNYEQNVAFIKWVGWHKDYDNLGNDIHTIDIK